MFKNSYLSTPFSAILLTGFAMINGCEQATKQEHLPVSQEVTKPTETTADFLERIRPCNEYSDQISSFRYSLKALLELVDFSDSNSVRESFESSGIKGSVKFSAVPSQTDILGKSKYNTSVFSLSSGIDVTVDYPKSNDKPVKIIAGNDRSINQNKGIIPMLTFNNTTTVWKISIIKG